MVDESKENRSGAMHTNVESIQSRVDKMRKKYSNVMKKENIKSSNMNIE